MTPPLNTPPPRPKASDFKRKVLPRLMFVLPFALSATLLWWSLDRIKPVIRESEELTRRTTKLTQQIEEMELRRRGVVKERVEERYSQAMDRNFTGQDAVAAWLEELRDRAITLALDFNPRFGDAEGHSVAAENLTLIPVTIEVKPAAGIQSGRNAYQRIMEFSHFLANHPKRADLLKLNITGRNGTAARAVFNLNLWGIAPKA